MFGNWLNGVEKNLKLIFRWEFRLFVGLFGIYRNDIVLIDPKFFIFCRLSSKPHTGFIFSPFYFLRIGGNFWILDATV